MMISDGTSGMLTDWWLWGPGFDLQSDALPLSYALQYDGTRLDLNWAVSKQHNVD
jgi:hypothetical protein